MARPVSFFFWSTTSHGAQRTPLFLLRYTRTTIPLTTTCSMTQTTRGLWENERLPKGEAIWIAWFLRLFARTMDSSLGTLLYLVIGIGAVVAVAVRGYNKRSLSYGGMCTSILIGILHILAGWRYAFLLIFFFATRWQFRASTDGVVPSSPRCGRA